MPALPYWIWPGDDRPTEEIDDEIAEELRLHLDLMAEENERRGMTPTDAQRQAAERFGDFDQLLRRCRREKQGDTLMLRRVQTALTLLLLVVVAFLGIRQWRAEAATASFMNQTTELLLTIREDVTDLNGRYVPTGIAPAPVPVVDGSFAPRYSPVGPGSVLGPDGKRSELIPAPENALKDEGNYQWVKLSVAGRDLRGVVTDAELEPVADADVLLIVKTWPNNRYRQTDIATKTNKSGAFGVGGVIPFKGQYGINAAVVAEGYAIASRYLLVEEAAGKEPAEWRLELTPSQPVRIVVTDGNGQPLERAVVAPSGRVTEDDDEILVYHQGSEPAWKKTDAEGAVTVDWFLPGDIAKVSVRPRGGEWQERKFDVTETREATISVED